MFVHHLWSILNVLRGCRRASITSATFGAKSVIGIMTKAKLILFVAGSSSRTTQAIESLRLLCDGHDDKIEFEIVDILENPQVAEKERVFATPMLVKTAPLPRRRVIGDLADRNMLKQRLDLNT